MPAWRTENAGPSRPSAPSKPFRPSCNSSSVAGDGRDGFRVADRLLRKDRSARMARGAAPRALRAAVRSCGGGDSSTTGGAKRSAKRSCGVVVERAIDANGAIIIEQRHERPRLVRGSLSRHGQQQRNARAPPSPKRRACRSRKNSSRDMTGSPGCVARICAHRRRNRPVRPSAARRRAALAARLGEIKPRAGRSRSSSLSLVVTASRRSARADRAQPRSPTSTAPARCKCAQSAAST